MEKEPVKVPATSVELSTQIRDRNWMQTVLAMKCNISRKILNDHQWIWYLCVHLGHLSVQHTSCLFYLFSSRSHLCILWEWRSCLITALEALKHFNVLTMQWKKVFNWMRCRVTNVELKFTASSANLQSRSTTFVCTFGHKMRHIMSIYM